MFFKTDDVRAVQWQFGYFLAYSAPYTTKSIHTQSFKCLAHTSFTTFSGVMHLLILGFVEVPTTPETRITKQQRNNGFTFSVHVCNNVY